MLSLLWMNLQYDIMKEENRLNTFSHTKGENRINRPRKHAIGERRSTSNKKYHFLKNISNTKRKKQAISHRYLWCGLLLLFNLNIKDVAIQTFSAVETKIITERVTFGTLAWFTVCSVLASELERKKHGTLQYQSTYILPSLKSTLFWIQEGNTGKWRFIWPRYFALKIH